MSYMRYHIHERVVVLTVVLVVVSGVLVWSRPANAIGNYNRSAAVAYADQWALSRNSNYPQFGNDCTNFASQLLQAGGYPQTNPGSYFTCDPSLWYQPFFVNMWWYTYSWINADCMRQFFSNRPQDFELYGGSPEYLQGGGDIRDRRPVNQTHSSVAEPAQPHRNLSRCTIAANTLHQLATKLASSCGWKSALTAAAASRSI